MEENQRPVQSLFDKYRYEYIKGKGQLFLKKNYKLIYRNLLLFVRLKRIYRPI